jgi:2-methylaconitate cis-trans-isomerase PrpF
MEWIDAVFMRGGTSKGLFFHARDLPADAAERDRIFTRALGSPDPFGRQLDGMGGGVSSLSKIVVVAAADRDGVDVEYTFGQVAVDEAIVDYSGNCGNLSSAVVPFALEAGLLSVEDGVTTVVVRNTNTDAVIAVRLHVRDGVAETAGDLVIPGVAGSGSPIELQYREAGGSTTGAVLPTGRAVDRLDIDVPGGPQRTIEVSLVDAAAPLVFVRAADVGLTGTESPEEIDADADLLALLDRIRRAGTVAMGLAATPEDSALAHPKIALVAPPATTTLLDGTVVPADDCALMARVLSMGVTHKAIPGTSALCLAAAARVPGTLVHDAATATEGALDTGTLRIATPSGVVTGAADVQVEDGVPQAASASLYRTARPLMRGQVAVPG